MGTDNGQPAADGSGLAGFLEPHAISGGVGKDLAMLRRAVVENWDVPPDVRRAAVGRMHEIIKRPSVEVLTKAGPFDSVAQADANAIGAAGVLERMVKTNQADRHHTENLAAGKAASPGSTTNILVLNIPPPRALEAAESPPSP